MKSQKKHRSNKIVRIIFILAFFLVFLGGIFLTHLLSKPQFSTSKETLDLWWVQTPSEDLICWGKNLCGWSWKYTSSYDSDLITGWGILQKDYPSKVINSAKLLSIKADTSYAPIGGFYSDSDYLIFNRSENKQDHIYIFSKKSKKIKELFASDNSIWLAKMRPDHQVALFGQSIKSQDSYFVVNLQTGKKGLPFTFDTFAWSEITAPDHYRVGLINKCNSQGFDVYNCPIYQDLLNCSDYPQIPETYYKNYKQLFTTQDFILNLSDNWDRSVYFNELYRLDNSAQFIEFKKNCSSDIGNLYPQSWIRRFKVDLAEARLIQFVNPRLITGNYPDQYLLAVVEVNFQSQYYQFFLYTNEPKNIKRNTLLVKDMTQLLGTLRFIKNFK